MGRAVYGMQEVRRQLGPGGCSTSRSMASAPTPGLTSAATSNVRPVYQLTRVRSSALRLRHGRVGHRALKYRATGSNV
jgi:hypothetical protein